MMKKILNNNKIKNIILILILSILYACSMNIIFLEASHTFKDIIAYTIIKLIKINDPYGVFINNLITRTLMLPPCDFKMILQNCLNNPEILKDYLIHGKKFIDENNNALKETVNNIILTLEEKIIANKEHLEILKELEIENKQFKILVIIAFGSILLTGIILSKVLP